MAIKYLAGDRLIGTAAERAALSGTTATAIAQTSWKVIARATMNGANADLDTGTGNGTTNNCVVTENTMYATPKDNIMILAHLLTSTNNACDLTFNADSGSNYIKRFSGNGGSDSVGSATTLIDCRYNSNQDTFLIGEFRNVATEEKLGFIHTAHDEPASGAGSAPDRKEILAKWVNTSNQINRIKFSKGSFTNFASGTELVVLGCDDDEADSGTNFWQELANPTDLASAGDTLDTGTMTAKKYLMVNVFRTRSGAVNSRIQVNGDTGSNYAHRNMGANNSYGSDATVEDSASIHTQALTANDSFTTYFIVNKSDREKLMIIHEANRDSAGTGSTPERTEAVAKWANTSNAITSINVINTDSGSLDVGTSIRVWGSD